MMAIMSNAPHPLDGIPTRRRALRDGETLFRRGDPVRHLYAVRQGEVRLVRHQPHGAALILHRARAGAVLAEASLFSPTYHCDAVAAGDADLDMAALADVRDRLRDPAFAERWAACLAAELQRTRIRAEILSIRTVADRLDAWLAFNGALPDKGGWASVASEIGTSPEALYRELARRRTKRAPAGAL